MIAVELQLLLRRRRVWLCWLLLCALPALVAVLLAVTDIVPPPGRGGNFLSAVVSNGQLFPAAALALVLPIFLPITVAIVAGDTVAGEASAGTLRYLLVRPVGRLRLLAAKLASVTAFVLLAVLLALDAAAAIRDYLPTTHWLAWVDLYRDPVLLPAIRKGVAVQAGWILVAFGAAWANFATKDVTS